ncbi:MAG: hypothetical protein ABSC94_05780 [Polyangiaceae bacterium]
MLAIDLRAALSASRSTLCLVQSAVLSTEALLGSRAAAPRHATWQNATWQKLIKALRQAETQLKRLLLAVHRERIGFPTRRQEEGPSVRRLAALFAWFDEGYPFSARTVDGVEARDDDLRFLLDAERIDAYADALDSSDWNAPERSAGRPYYDNLARAIVDVLRTPETQDHVDRVRRLMANWEI